MGIRSAAKAIIIHEGKILLNKCRDEQNGEYYSLPGGGQNQYESLEEAVIRECMEETGYHVTPVRFAALYEEICDGEAARSNYPEYCHRIYHVFLCELTSDQREIPAEQDLSQLSSQWVEVSSLAEKKLLPKTIAAHIHALIEEEIPLYLGTDHIAVNHG